MLERHLEEIRDGLRRGLFQNEAAISQGIVLRILNALGWPTYDTHVVCPEFALEGRRVDFALCHPAGKPRVFVEVKQVGQADGAERQLFEYAFYTGIPVAVLTDGREWGFYLPGETGDYGERRVYKLDLIERDIAESVRRLKRYLDYIAVSSGTALQDARRDYESVARDREVESSLPEAWHAIIDDEDESLLELLADRVEDICGYKPDLDMVARFLKRVSGAAAIASVPVGQAKPKPNALQVVVPPVQVDAGAGERIWFSIRGQTTYCRSAREALVGVIEAMASADDTFLDRFVSLPRHGRTRRYIARDRTQLYPGRPDLAEQHSHRLKSGFWVGTNNSCSSVRLIIQTACEVAGLQYGKDVQVSLAP